MSTRLLFQVKNRDSLGRAFTTMMRLNDQNYEESVTDKMDIIRITEILEKHLKASESMGTSLYIKRMKHTIEKIKANGYQDDIDELIFDLESLGFVDIAKRVRQERFL